VLANKGWIMKNTIMFTTLFMLSRVVSALDVTQGQIISVNIRDLTPNPSQLEIQFSPGSGCSWITVPSTSSMFNQFYSGLLAAMATGSVVRINTNDNTNCYPQLNMGITINKP
jgi:hypothetical protein